MIITSPEQAHTERAQDSTVTKDVRQPPRRLPGDARPSREQPDRRSRLERSTWKAVDAVSSRLKERFAGTLSSRSSFK